MFFAAITGLQRQVDPVAPLAMRAALVELVLAEGPPPLQEAARQLDGSACRRALDDYLDDRDTVSANSFFARVLLQPVVAREDANPALLARAATARESAAGAKCPRCGHPPQVGCLRLQGDGVALALSCSLCLSEWSFPRGRCAGCNETDSKKLSYYGAEQLESLQVHACDSCRRYIHVVDLSKDREAVPEVDELAALALGVWAAEQGYRKLRPNLLGI